MKWTIPSRLVTARLLYLHLTLSYPLSYPRCFLCRHVTNACCRYGSGGRWNGWSQYRRPKLDAFISESHNDSTMHHSRRDQFAVTHRTINTVPPIVHRLRGRHADRLTHRVQKRSIGAKWRLVEEDASRVSIGIDGGEDRGCGGGGSTGHCSC